MRGKHVCRDGKPNCRLKLSQSFPRHTVTRLHRSTNDSLRRFPNCGISWKSIPHLGTQRNTIGESSSPCTPIPSIECCLFSFALQRCMGKIPGRAISTALQNWWIHAYECSALYGLWLFCLLGFRSAVLPVTQCVEN